MPFKCWDPQETQTHRGMFSRPIHQQWRSQNWQNRESRLRHHLKQTLRWLGDEFTLRGLNAWQRRARKRGDAGRVLLPRQGRVEEPLYCSVSSVGGRTACKSVTGVWSWLISWSSFLSLCRLKWQRHRISTVCLSLTFLFLSADKCACAVLPMCLCLCMSSTSEERWIHLKVSRDHLCCHGWVFHLCRPLCLTALSF